MVSAMIDGRWPEAGFALVDRLRRSPGHYAIIMDGEGADSVARRIAEVRGEEPLPVGRALAESPDARHQDDVLAVLDSRLVLTDIDALLWRPTFGFDVLRLLSVLSRRQGGVVAVWPGDIRGAEATYSEPGRPDFVRQILTDVIVLRPRPVTFDDEVPFETVRLP